MVIHICVIHDFYDSRFEFYRIRMIQIHKSFAKKQFFYELMIMDFKNFDQIYLI